MTELLCPAGTFEKMKWAVAYGADAVYFGMKEGSLRSYAGNFTLDEAEQGLRYLHERGCKGYAAMNIYPFSEEYSGLLEMARNLEEMGADALIISDIGLLFELRKSGINTPVHISTQANTLSHQTVLAYMELGAKRVNLARELSFDRIKDIQIALKGKPVETEVFIHGAVCFSYSGRCAISDYLTGRRANRGECTQPCRWKYYLTEETRPGKYMPVFEDERGLYFFNSKDLALFPFVEPLRKLGVASLKIEGRMKTVHYLATVISFYRRVLDGEKFEVKEGLELLGRASNKGYSYGFMKGDITPEDYSFDTQQSSSTATYVAQVSEKISDRGILLEIKNSIKAGETLELLTPDGRISRFVLPNPLVLDNGTEVNRANNEQTVIINDSFPTFTILRRVIKESS